MADIIDDLAAKNGISPEQAKKGLGAVLSFVKCSLPEDDFAKVSEAVPDSDQIMAAAETGAEQTGGILGSLKDAAGKILGGGGAAALLSKLSGLGLSAEQVKSFVPKVLEFLKSKLPDSVMNQVNGLLPMPEATPA